MIILVNPFFAGSRGGHRDHRGELHDALHEVRKEADHQRAAEELHQQNGSKGSEEQSREEEEAGEQRLHSGDGGGDHRPPHPNPYSSFFIILTIRSG